MFRQFRKEVMECLKDFDVDERFVKESEHADLASTIAFKLAKERNDNPVIVAEEIVSQLEPSGYIGSIESLNGYINFFADYEFLEDTINFILDTDENYGSLNLEGKILIEHTSANPDGPLHIGHIRNSVIGDTLARIFKKAGFDVTTHFYVNDMGRQVALTVLGSLKFGLDERKKGDHAVADAYIGINRYMEEKEEEKEEIEKSVEELMLKYENGDKNTVPLFENIVDKAVEGIRETLKFLGISHNL
ncbi:MAG TPA: arginine--tRNA ligase, partial [Archaeoglobaceae archaeon]|nr:arginine--tRNA ligase [Archaeoglobaceae archaeon]